LVGISEQAETIAAEPLAYLRDVADRCRALQQYTLTFTRHERRGLFRQMYGPEHIAAWFRREPFSVRLKWLDADVKYDETAYAAGWGNNKVRFVTRWWTPPLLPPPAVNKVDPTMPVLWGESRRPLTDFGLERLMEQTLAAIKKAQGAAVVRYEGPVRLDDGGQPAHHFHIEVPTSQSLTPVQELFIDIATNLPAGTIIKTSSGQIEATYFYEHIDAAVTLRDDDFLLPPERSAAGRTSTSP
jgi:hypothetical protein